VADVVAVLAFTLIGIASHDGSLIAAFGRVVWPFALAAAIGWAWTRAWHDPARVWPTGVLIWFTTVVVGLVLRGVRPGAGLVVRAGHDDLPGDNDARLAGPDRGPASRPGGVSWVHRLTEVSDFGPLPRDRSVD